MKKLTLLIIIAVIISIPLGVKYHFYDKGELVRLEIPSGIPAVKIADILKDNGIIESKLWFKICLKLSGAAPLLRSGTFELNKNTASLEVIWRLTNDSGAMLERIKIPEGWRIEEIAEELFKRNIIPSQDEFTQTARAQALEGYLFPSTYFLRKNMKVHEVIDIMTAEYKKNIAPLILSSGTNMTEGQILTIASIVEREAVQDDERPRIAAVYLNRIKIGKRLEADPTVQYALGFNDFEQRHWKKGLTLKDLRYDSPYNTYRYNGIPPGPICSPGVNSVRAVLYPEADFDALYFVADNKGEGRHLFSRTYNQHVQNIRAVRKR